MSQLYRTLTGQSQKSPQASQASGLAVPPPLTRTTTTDPETGVLNHLTPDQKDQLEVFKGRLHQDGWWSPDGVNGKPTHDEGTLLRYLRARKFDIEGAVGQFSDTEKWMKEQKIEELYDHFDVEFYERARLMYPQWTGHRDKRGIPIYVFELKGLDSKAVSKYQKESQAYKDKAPEHKKLSTPAKLLPLFALYQNLLNFVLPLCSSLERPQPEVPVTNSTNIVDISGVGLGQFWNLKQHMQDASVLATAHYPETLDRIFIIGAPSFFPTVWGWVKRWFDPVTVSKIFILSKHEVKPTLSKFMEARSFPKKYGGELNWSWGDVPDLDAETRAALERDGHKGWARGPCLWLEGQRLIVGSANGKLRRSDREVAEKMPIVYAADYTEAPVHPDRKASIISGQAAARALESASSHATTNGHANGHVPATSAGAAAGATATATAVHVHNETPEHTATHGRHPTHGRPSTPVRSDIPHENIRLSPAGDSHVNLPREQAAPPSTTVEYISPTTSPTPQRAEVHDTGAATSATTGPTAVAAAVPVSTTPASTTPRFSVHSAITTANVAPSSPHVPTQSYVPAQSHVRAQPHVPAQPQAGPMSTHQAAMNRQIARRLEGESVSVIPASAEGSLPHPEIITTSDTSKGLAMETDKLNLNGTGRSHLTTGRPHVERFVTAAEF